MRNRPWHRAASLLTLTVAVSLTPAGADAAFSASEITADSHPAPRSDGSISGPTPSGKAAYPGDPEAEAGYVAAEDDRLVQVRTVESLTQWNKGRLMAPYRLSSGSTDSLVLPARREPYTVKDLLVLAPKTFVRRSDGSYLLSENVVVQTGATLALSQPGGLRLLLASDTGGFVSVVNYGGQLKLAGTKRAPVTITSLDRATSRPDTFTDDGRAYLRSIGGKVTVSYTDLSDLGFWSGRTGGLSLTGADHPRSGTGARADRGRGTVPASRRTVQSEGGPGSGRTAATRIFTNGILRVPTVDVPRAKYTSMSASVRHLTVEGDAFGLFVSRANNIVISDSSFKDNLVDGLVMQRYVMSSDVRATSSTGNGGDGFLLARATTGVALSELRADRNTHNGVTLSGLPLADGPSATGTSVGSYGNNSVSDSEMSGNGHYGVEVVGGEDISVRSSTMTHNRVGVVVRAAATSVSLADNRISGSLKQGIALRDGVQGGTITGNKVSGGDTSVYVRDAQAVVRRNTLTGARTHAVSLVGSLSTSRVSGNTMAGRGPSAIDSDRAVGVDRSTWSNNVSGWSDTTPFAVRLKRFLQPLTLMWLVLASILVLTALRGARSRRVKAHPYGDKAPVSDGHVTAPQPREKAEV